MGKGGSVDTRVPKTVAATTFEDEQVKQAGENTRRRIAAAKSRDASNSYWTSLLSYSDTSGRSSGARNKQTLG